MASLLAPEILFSGQHNFHLFTMDWAGHSATYLMIISFAKLLLIAIVLNTGWVGGDIFPVLFSATVQGLAVSQWLPNLDRTFIMVMIAMGVGSAVLESPLLVGSLMAIMFAPINLLPFVIFATILLMVVKSLQRRYTKYAPTVFDQIGDWMRSLKLFGNKS
ncbi:chloride channel protein [Secundilactobacillus oryzae]|uniref:chloride channel protein n=1 Tax=Secundilactobacillus oryzae TaxID=1202668 RepID=UPI0006D1C8C0|nr:chloride channel protein [Secundilactobacillus oryzae]